MFKPFATMAIESAIRSITIISYKISIVSNIQEEFSPQYWNITTFHTSVNHIFAYIFSSIKIIILFILTNSYLLCDAFIDFLCF